MPVAIALILAVLALAIALVGFLWTAILLFPFYAYIAIAIYLTHRSNRKSVELTASIRREVEAQRQFNAQETRAWQRSLENDDEAL